MTGTAEGFLTMIALERTLSRVGPLMFRFGAVSAEFLGTILTGIRFFSRMNPDMIDEMILLPESGPASLTLKRPLGQVRLVVA